MKGIRIWAVGLAMLAAAGLAVAVKPSERMADSRPKIDLEAAIPKSFGDWKIDTSIVPIAPTPDVQALLDKIYSQILARTYVDSKGQRVMLSIAYGGDQSRDTQVHKPEVCYPAQGFKLQSVTAAILDTEFGGIPATRLFTTMGQRKEPVTYWFTVGDSAIKSGIEKRIVEFRYGLTGQIPDGMLFRVSSIDGDQPRAFGIQDQFVTQLLNAVPPGDRLRLSGLGKIQTVQ